MTSWMPSYPDTFDPPTLGHLNIIQRVANKFDRLVIALGKNSSKTASAFSIEEAVFQRLFFKK